MTENNKYQMAIDEINNDLTQLRHNMERLLAERDMLHAEWLRFSSLWADEAVKANKYRRKWLELMKKDAIQRAKDKGYTKCEHCGKMYLDGFIHIRQFYTDFDMCRACNDEAWEVWRKGKSDGEV